MFDNIGRVAEQVATSVSRRRFLGSVGRWAGATALGLGGFLTGATARAGEGYVCCGPYWFRPCGTPFNSTSSEFACCKAQNGCPATIVVTPHLNPITLYFCPGSFSTPVPQCKHFCPASKC